MHSTNDQQLKEKKAIGLKYNGPKTGAPKVVSRGFGKHAEHIIQAAKDAGILVHEDPYLADFLAKLQIGDDIPEEVYTLIAELIAFATWLNLKA